MLCWVRENRVGGLCAGRKSRESLQHVCVSLESYRDVSRAHLDTRAR